MDYKKRQAGATAPARNEWVLQNVDWIWSGLEMTLSKLSKIATSDILTVFWPKRGSNVIQFEV